MGDYIKGKVKNTYPEFIQDGIRFHRFIDSYTDQHEIVRKHGRLMEPKIGHLSGVATDMLYDYVLAKNWNDFHDEVFEVFVNKVYEEVLSYSEYFPRKFEFMFRYMRRDNWLGAYQTEEGMLRALNGLSQKIKFENDLPACWPIFLEHEEQITKDYKVFLKDIQNEISQQFA